MSSKVKNSVENAGKNFNLEDLSIDAIMFLKKVFDKVKAKSEHAQEKLEEVQEGVVESAVKSQEHLLHYIKENPLKTLGISALAIAGIALLVSE